MNPTNNGDTKPQFQIASDTWLRSQATRQELKQSIERRINQIRAKQARLATLTTNIEAEIQGVKEDIDGIEGLIHLQDKAQDFACQAMYYALTTNNTGGE